MTTQIVKCKCKHEQQDAIHGEGKRVANHCAKAQHLGMKAARCTVCSTLHTQVQQEKGKK